MRPGALDLLADIALGEAVNPDDARRLLDAAAKAEPCDFYRVLGVDRLARVRLRDGALVAAAGHLGEQDAWQGAKVLHGALARFHGRVLGTDRPLDEHESELLRAHWSAAPRLRCVESLWYLLK